MLIRKQLFKDTEELLQIWYEASITAHSFIDEAFWKEQKESLRTVYLPLAETWVAEEERKITGFISIMDRGYIGGLFVDPHSQGKGIGTRLIEHAQTLNKTLSVGVYKKNHKAIRFYEKCGFRSVEEAPQKETGEMVIYMVGQY